MATLGRAFCLINGAEISSAISKVSFGDMPASAMSFSKANSLSAQSGLSRKRAIWWLVFAHIFCNTSRGSAKIFLASRQISIRPLVLGFAITWLWALRFRFLSTANTASRSALRIWITAPNSSLNKARKVCSWRRPETWSAQFFASPQSASCPTSTAIMSTLMEIPVWDAKDISAIQANNPPSERSWYASNWLFLRNSIIAAARALRSSGWSTFGVNLPDWFRTWARMLLAMRFLPRPKSIKINSVSKAMPDSSMSLSKGVVVLRTSCTAAKAEIINETGDTTRLDWSPSCHAVAIDKESLPTGMEIPKAGQSSIPIAFTDSYNLASSPGLPQAAIQLAESFTSSKRRMSVARRLVIASPTAILAAAGASITANGVRSPIDIASPR